MTFMRRRINATFRLGTGVFGDGTPQTHFLSGMRGTADVVKAGGASMGALNARFYGLTLDVMNTLSTLGVIPTEQRRNTIILQAGDQTSAPSSTLPTVFQGTIRDAWIDFGAIPDVAFNVVAYTGLYDAVKPVPPMSFSGGTSVAVVMQQLAATMGLALENNDVQVELANPYFSGTARVQAYECAKAADINIDISDGILAIWPKGGSRIGKIDPITPQSGLVGYPTYTSQGIEVTTIFNPTVKVGRLVQVTSSQSPASTQWRVVGFAHNLASETPNGPWFTKLSCVRPEYAPIT